MHGIAYLTVMPNAIKKMTLYRQLLIFTSFLTYLSLTSCDFSDAKLIIRNQSSDSIAFIIPAEPNYFPTSDTIGGPQLNKHINDSLLATYAKYNPEDESFGGVHFLAKDTMKHLLAFNTKWEHIVDQAPNKTLEIFFFPTYVMTSGKYKWKEIWDNKMYTDKKSFTKDELDNADWNVNYGK
jgi:hypothetical protein